MERLLAWLERRYGGYAIGGITYYMAGVMGLVLIANLGNPGLTQRLTLEPTLVMEGEYWRLITWAVIPPAFDPLWGLLGIYFFYLMGSNLEAQWGSFKFELYLFTGIVSTAVIAMVLGMPTGNGYLIMSLFLAFATMFPDFTIMLFFIIPVKVKYLAMLDALLLLGAVGWSTGMQRLFPVVAMLNYLLYFTPFLKSLARRYLLRAKHQQEFQGFRREVTAERPVRTCAKCGLSEKQDPRAEFRVCICEKCGGKATDYCLQHATNH